jgi:hypothetical protein
VSNQLKILPKVLDDLQKQLDWNSKNDWADVAPQLKSFCHSYLETYNYKKACVAAGLPVSHGPRFLQDPFVAGYIDHITEHYVQDSLISRRFVEIELLEQYARCTGEVATPWVDSDGGVHSVKQFNAGAANNVLKEMGKIANVYPTGLGGGAGAVQVNINLEALGLGQQQPIIQGVAVDVVVNDALLTIDIPESDDEHDDI